MVSTSARICVGWNSLVRPFHTGTPAYCASTSTFSWAEPRYSMRVERATEDSCGVLHRLLVADLRTAGREVGDVRALVLRRDLEGRAGPRRGLLEDHRDVLAGEAGLLVAGVLGRFEVGSELEQEAQLVRGEVELLEEAPVAEVERQRRSFAQAVASTAGLVVGVVCGCGGRA